MPLILIAQFKDLNSPMSQSEIQILRRQLEIAIAALQVVANRDDRSGVVDALKAINQLGQGCPASADESSPLKRLGLRKP